MAAAPYMSARIGILGVGAVGARVARQLLSSQEDVELVLSDLHRDRASAVAQDLGPRAAALRSGRIEEQGIDVLVIATPCGHHGDVASSAISLGVSVVSVSDRIEDVDALFALEATARSSDVRVVVGAGFAPGLTCLLAAHGAAMFDEVHEVHVAKAGTGGPACARQHHRALKGAARDWRGGGWIRRPGGSGRELAWFPEPVGGADCYRAALPDAIVLRERFLAAERLTARMAATRQDRFTSWLPMLSPPHPEGGVGAVRVELRGVVSGERVVHVLGAAERPAIAAAAVAAQAVEVTVARSEPPGVAGLATVRDPAEQLRALARRGLTAQMFEGSPGA